MKIAVIVITYNDDYKFQEWCRWHEEYKQEIALHVIVDNGSSPDYIHKVESYFKDSYIIKRTSNGGCTAAYNDGIRYALSQNDITHIALIGNDIRLEANTLTTCAGLLDSDSNLGMIAPVLLEPDSTIIANYGCSIGDDLSMIAFDKGEEVSSVKEDFRYCECVQGGMNVSKRSFYEVVGLQDEKLFMYSDEVDMAFRAKACGLKMAVTKRVKTWHQHIKSPVVVKRHPYSYYLIARNKVYVAKKHFGNNKAKLVFNEFFLDGLKKYIINVIKFKFDTAQCFRWQMIGAYKGRIGDMRANRFSHL